jgi:hypothetical protein
VQLRRKHTSLLRLNQAQGGCGSSRWGRIRSPTCFRTAASHTGTKLCRFPSTRVPVVAALYRSPATRPSLRPPRQLGLTIAMAISMRQILAVFLTLILSGQLVTPSEPPTNPREQIRTLPIGTQLEVKMKGGDRVRGQLLSVDPDSFAIAVGRVKTKTARVIRFGEAESVRAQPHAHTSVIAWVAAGALVAVVVIVVATVLIERHNEGG